MNSKHNEGMALMIVVFSTIVIVGAATLIMNQVYAAKRHGDGIAAQVTLDESLKGAIDLTIADLWSGFSESTEDENTTGFFAAGNIDRYRAYLDTIVADGTTETLEISPETFTGNAKLIELKIARHDNLRGAELTISAHAEYDGRPGSAEQSLSIGGQPFRGAGFALLARNADCVLCHTRVLPSGWDATTPTTKQAHTAFLAKSSGSIAYLSARQLGAHPAESATPETIANLYRENADDMPVDIPSPFPDYNGNRKVDDGEFFDVAEFASGSLDGNILFGDENLGYLSGALPTKSNLASIRAGYDGNLILLGTSDTPIAFTPVDTAAYIAINGDLVISGPITGRGQLLVRGNVYIIGDLTHASPDAALAITAGGSILLSDFTQSSATVADAATMNFNQHEYQQASAEMGFVPRYYRAHRDAPLRAFDHDAAETLYARDTTDPNVYQLGEQALVGAAVMTFAPTSAWLTTTQLSAWWDQAAQRQDDSRPRKISAFLYSPNAIFGTTIDATTANETETDTNGWEIHGALIASDIALLIPNGGLTILHDDRIQRFIRIDDRTKLALQRLIYRRA